MFTARKPTEYERLVKLEEISAVIRSLKNEELNLTILAKEDPAWNDQLEVIKQELARKQREVDAIKEEPLHNELPTQPNKNNAGFVQEKLAANNKSEAKESLIDAPLRKFSEDDLEKIREHHETLPPHLQSIMEAVAFDTSVNDDLIPTPVFLRKSGHLYDKKTLDDLLQKGKATCPVTRLPFEQKDIIPCNTTIKAMSLLLGIIDHGEEKLTTVEKSNDIIITEKTNTQKSPRISSELVLLLEQIYKKMEDKHKILFDLVMRDPITKKIMTDPVLLRDGYVYERSTAESFLARTQRCPQNPRIPLIADDITNCHFVVAVADLLAKHAAQLQKVAQITSVPLHDTALEAQRAHLIQELNKLVVTIRTRLEQHDPNTNQYMEPVLQAAIEALLHNDPSILEKAKQINAGYSYVTSVANHIFGGHVKANSFWGKFAASMGTTKGQSGNSVRALVEQVIKTMALFAEPNNEKSLKPR